MPRPNHPEHKLDLGPLPPANLSQLRSGNSAGAESPEFPGASPRYQLGNAMAAVGSRTSAGSPSKEFGGSRLFPKRAREIQAQEGLSPLVWRPPPIGSGHSTPLRETIPESPTNNDFPDFGNTTSSIQPPASATLPSTSTSLPARRLRAGTVPSRFSPEELTNLSLTPTRTGSRSIQPSPATTPLDMPSTSLPSELGPQLSSADTSTLLSRLRAGSMPQRTALVTNINTFGPSYANSGWSTPRSRANTMQGAQSAGLPSNPQRGHFSRESFADGDAKTLDYLGLVDSPQPSARDVPDVTPGNPLVAQLAALNDLKKNANRLRSYSVNAKERYDEYNDDGTMPLESSSAYAASAGQFSNGTPAHASVVQEAVRQHNLDVQLFAQLANASRPRARTAGMLESPSSRVLRSYLPTPSRLDNSMSTADLDMQGLMGSDVLSEAVRSLHIDVDAADDSINETPSRALWLGNIPSSTTVSSLNAIFEGYGPIESARVLTHKSCGFVNFENMDSAIIARSQLHNKELFPGAGPIRIGFAKAPSGNATPGVVISSSPDLASFGQTAQAGALRPSASVNADTAAAALKTPSMSESRSEIIAIVQELGASGDELTKIRAGVEQAVSYDLYHSEPPQPTEPSPVRMHDAPKLREYRKRMDHNNCATEAVEQIALEMLPEIAELSSDYLGNTVVQKLFENCSEQMKEAMLEAIAPRMAEIGMHKNGTWAAQKIIDVAHTPAQMTMIVNALRPHAIQLFLDQYGNYVIQCCLRFGAPYNDFIFDCMLQRLWEVAQGRYGARAMRACLESHHATKEQQRMLAAAIALHSVQLATNTNGALLLTWLLDTCTFPHRRAVLAPRLIAHLVHLCTHKVAYLTVLKVINQRAEAEARDMIVSALFQSAGNAVLEAILSDQACGATFVYKVLSTPFLNDKVRPEAVENVRSALTRLNAQPQQGYKRLMDEVGLATRQSGVQGSRDASSTRSASRSRGPGTFQQNFDQPQQTYVEAPFPNMVQPQPLDMAQAQRASSFDSTVMDPYVAASVGTPSYTHSPTISGMPPLTPQQIQYQQAMLAQQQAAINAQRGNTYLHSPVSGYRASSPGMDAYGRPPSMGGSPVGGGFVGQGYHQQAHSPMMAMGGYQYPVGYFPQQPQGQIGGQQRRGRVNGPHR